ncbi:Fur family transcriptional regulator [Anaerofustis stercorihominis]|uniref:Fur family transcriptional regulator n=1 Tax=Anaerofustis stercorihominis TaxID=214853 RepID=UPI0011063F61|nr:transcriptional repressor [Anaerofustis stercorihominis]
MNSHYNTKQRKILIDCFENMDKKHFRASDVLEYLEKENSNIGKSTVYRQLESMVNEGILNKYIIDINTPACFEYEGKSRHEDMLFHLKCEKCGKLIHLHCHEIDDFQKHLYTTHNFKLNPKRTVFYGICEECEKKNK